MRRVLLLTTCLGLAACASRPAPVAVAPPPPVPVAAAAPVFQGHPGLIVPPRTADGGYATPNAAVSAAGAIWHLRAGLNVAALSCRGPDEAALVASYNGLLRAHAATFERAYRMLGQEHDGVAGFDAAMTRLYNYYALPPAQPGLCAAAQLLLAELALTPPGALDAAAPAALARLDQPYNAVFAQQDAWLAIRFAARAPVLAALPRIEIDRTVLAQP